MWVGIRTGTDFFPAKTLPFDLKCKPYLHQKFNFAQTLTLEMGTEEAPPPAKRPFCSSCSKPASVCLCSRFKSPLLDNSISVTILQHSQEKKHPLNSTRIAALGLKNLTVATVTDVHSEAQFLIRLLKSHSDEEPPLKSVQNHLPISDFGSVGDVEEEEEETVITATVAKNGVTCSLTQLLTSETHLQNLSFDQMAATQIGKDAISNGFIVKKLQRKQMNESLEFEEHEEYEIVIPPGSALLFPTKNSVTVEAVDFDVKHLVVLDGTWRKAKRMYHENPWLKFLPHLKLESCKMSLYSEVRQQPKPGCLSTIESILFAMKALGDDQEGLSNLLDVFESMVGDQRRCKIENDIKLSTATP